MLFDKSSESFPVRKHLVFLNNCGIAAMYGGSARSVADFANDHSGFAPGFLSQYPTILRNLRKGAGELLKVPPEDISVVKNTAEGLNLVANGYPFREGDEIISYIHEYPSNHYPWRIQEKRGAKLKLLSDVDPIGELPTGKPRGWSMEELKETVTDKTRIVAISHVQFASGFAADMPELGAFCKERGIDLVVDAAQSLGCLPLYPAEWNVSCVASSGWKWLLGPIGTGILYTSPEFRRKIGITMAGADLMKQGDDYLNHEWQPHESGRMFEYSTCQIGLVAGLSASINDLFVKYGIENIRNEVFRLQDLFLENLGNGKFKPLRMPEKNRSGIIAIDCGNEDLPKLVSSLLEKGIYCSTRAGYLRIAPHFHNTDEEILKVARILNSL